MDNKYKHFEAESTNCWYKAQVSHIYHEGQNCMLVTIGRNSAIIPANKVAEFFGFTNPNDFMSRL